MQGGQLSEVSSPKLFEKRGSAGRVLALISTIERYFTVLTLVTGEPHPAKTLILRDRGDNASTIEDQQYSIGLQHFYFVIQLQERLGSDRLPAA